MNDFIEIIKHMESIDKLSNESIISDESLIEIIENSVLYSPSLLEKNTSNIVVLLDKRHTQFWREIVLKQIKEENLND